MHCVKQARKPLSTLITASNVTFQRIYPDNRGDDFWFTILRPFPANVYNYTNRVVALTDLSYVVADPTDPPAPDNNALVECSIIESQFAFGQMWPILKTFPRPINPSGQPVKRVRVNLQFDDPIYLPWPANQLQLTRFGSVLWTRTGRKMSPINTT